MAVVNLENRDWQCAKTKLIERSEYLLRHGQWTDCLFLVGPESKPFKAHKLILGMSCPVFAAMFYGQLAEKDEPILIPDVQSDIFEKLLDYIYCDRFDEGWIDIALDLCYAAMKYMLPDLVEKCLELMCGKMPPSIAIKSYEFAKLIDNSKLLQRSLSVIRDEIDEILVDPNIEDVALDMWLAILDSDELGIATECELMDALYKWAVKECKRKELDENQENLRSVVGPALGKIRFLSMSEAEFTNGPWCSQLLSKEEIAAILTNKNNVKDPLPSSISMSTELRGRQKPFLLEWCKESPESNIIYVNLFSRRYNNKRFRGGPFSWTMAFTVDHAVRIHGFKITAFYDRHDTTTWKHFMEAYLLAEGPERLALMTNSDEIVPKSEKVTFIKWDSVVTVLPNTSYRIRVYFNNGKLGSFVRHYPTGETTIKKRGVTFVLKSYDVEDEVGTAVPSILFSLP